MRVEGLQQPAIVARIPLVALWAAIDHDTGPCDRPALIEYWKEIPILGEVGSIMDKLWRIVWLFLFAFVTVQNGAGMTHLPVDMNVFCLFQRMVMGAGDCRPCFTWEGECYFRTRKVLSVGELGLQVGNCLGPIAATFCLPVAELSHDEIHHVGYPSRRVGGGKSRLIVGRHAFIQFGSQLCGHFCSVGEKVCLFNLHENIVLVIGMQ
jgi:hypothetical protein